MSPRTILAALTTPAAARRILPVATALARRTGAHLIGYHTIEAIAVYPGIAMHITEADLAGFTASQEEQAEEIRKIFESATRAEDFAAEWRLENAQSLSAADRIVQSARAADLVVMSQQKSGEDRPDQRNIQERVIRESGRPVLVVPYAGSFGETGQKVMIGWSPTREAARAAHDAISLIAPGGEALLVTARHASDQRRLAHHTAAEMALCLDRHGIRTTVIDRTDDGITPGDVLLNEAFETGCDLIVVGAFGHSMVYDLVIGATTTHLLDHMTAPVLFSA